MGALGDSVVVGGNVGGGRSDVDSGVDALCDGRQTVILPISDGNPWYGVADGDLRVRTLLNRHYSGRKSRAPGRPKKSLGPGEYVLLLTLDSRAVFSWIRNTIPRDDGQTGVNCSLFRNEGPVLSSALILAAEEFAQNRWPENPRLFTYVNPRAVASPNPGYCFQVAGWTRRGKSKSGKILLDKLLPVKEGEAHGVR